MSSKVYNNVIDYIKENPIDSPFPLNFVPSKKRYKIEINGKQLQLSEKQYQAMFAPTQLTIVQCGLGFGKTYMAVIFALFYSLFVPGCTGYIISPTLNMAKETTMLKLVNLLDLYKINYKHNKSENTISIFVKNPNYNNEIVESRIIFFSAEKIERIEGKEMLYAVIDEVNQIKTEKELDKQLKVVDKTSSRLRERDMRAPQREEYDVQADGSIVKVMRHARLKDIFGNEVSEKLLVIGTPKGQNPLYDKYIAQIHDFVTVVHATSYESPFLSYSYLQQQEKSFGIGTPLFLQEILGLNVSFEGQVFSNFDKRKHVISQEEIDKKISEGKIKILLLGKDWGFNPDPGVSIYIGVELGKSILEHKYYILEEDVTKKRNVAYSDYETSWSYEDYKNVLKYHNLGLQFGLFGNNQGIYADKSRKEEFEGYYDKFGLYFNFVDNSIAAGVVTMYKLINEGRFFVNEKCEHTIKEIQNYTHKNGRSDEFIGSDHCLDSIRYVLHSIATEYERYAT